MKRPYLSYLECAARYPHITAAIMRHGYLTTDEAAAVIRDYRQFPDSGRRTYWTDLKRATLAEIISAMRAPAALDTLRANLAHVRAMTRACPVLSNTRPRPVHGRTSPADFTPARSAHTSPTLQPVTA